MKKVTNQSELISNVESENHYYDGHNYENYQSLKEDAERFFIDNTSNSDNPKEYFENFGLKFGECHIEKVKVEKYFDNETDSVLTVDFYEGYVDSGVSEEDYFHGFIIS